MRLTTEQTEWIEANRDADTARLRLSHSGDADMARLIMQVECRRKCARKLPDTLRCREFSFPTALSAEQCTSDAIARFHASLVAPGETVLDMTAGLGIDAFHIARHAASVTAIDITPETASAIMDNATALGITNVEAINADSIKWIEGNDRKFDTIFIDPARRGDCGERLYSLAECRPDVTALLPKLAGRCRRLIVKASPMLDISRVIEELPGVTDLYVTGTRDECKELVASVDCSGTPTGEPRIHAVTISGGDTATESFTLAEERAAEARYADPCTGGILYEPWPAVMKSGMFKLLCSRYETAMPHPNTHLYTGTGDCPEFPGESYRIMEIHPFSSSALKALTRRRLQASVAVRNFGMSANVLRQRLRCSESATTRLIGVTSLSGKMLLLVERI